MTTSFTAFDSYKLNTQFSVDGTSFVHTIPETAPGENVRVERWTRVERIGKGAFGSVYKEKCDNGDVRAVKVVLRLAMNIQELLALTRMTQYTDYFVQLSGWFQDDTNIYLAMEYFPCGDLHSFILESQGGLSQPQIKTVTRQLLEGLTIMHSLSFCHRDLKPQNVLVVTWFPLVVKIADFGTTKEAGDETALRTFVGTPDYLAPEVLGIIDTDTSEYTDAVDMWSMGCLIFAMATKKTPFPGTKGLEAFIKGLTFPGDRLVEAELKEFIVGFMRPMPGERLTAKQALDHAWLNSGDDTWDGEINLSNGSGQEKATIDPTGIQAGNESDDDYDTWDAQDEVNSVPALSRSSVDQGPMISSVRVRRPDIKPDMRRVGLALTEAAAHGHREIVQRMLETGADLTFRDQNGNTALHRAVQRGHTDIVRFLLQAGADKMAKGFGNATPLIMAAACGYKELVQLLVDEGTDISAVDGEGYNVLHAAAQNGYPDLVRFLLECDGADIASGTGTGVATPLQVAARAGWVDVVKLLLEKGASTSDKGPRGFTALHSAASRGKAEVVKLLLDYGADSRVRTEGLSTALTLAATDGHRKVVKLLLDSGADIMEKGPHGYTALHLAAEEGHHNVVQLLLQRGADITATENEGSTALHLATAAGCLEVVDLLIGWGEGAAVRDSGIEKFQTLPIDYTPTGKDGSLVIEKGPKILDPTVGGAGTLDMPKQSDQAVIIEEPMTKIEQEGRPTLEEERTAEGRSIQNEYEVDISEVVEPLVPKREEGRGEGGLFQESRANSSTKKRPTTPERERNTIKEERPEPEREGNSRVDVQPKLEEAVPGINIAESRRKLGKFRMSGRRSRSDKKSRCVIS